MYAVIRRYEIAPDVADEVTRHVRVGFLPLVSQEPGFVGYYWLKIAEDTYVSVGVFTDRAGAERSTAEAAAYLSQHLAPLLPRAPEIWQGEVLVHQMD